MNREGKRKVIQQLNRYTHRTNKQIYDEVVRYILDHPEVFKKKEEKKDD